MSACNIEKMLNNTLNFLYFSVGNYNLKRGLVGNNVNTEIYISATKKVVCWLIVDDKLEQISDRQVGVLFNAETYLIQWTFEIKDKDKTVEDTVFYHWKGSNSTKGGFSPLPPEYESENPVVERISQWSEPPWFFHIFSKGLVVFNGRPGDFNSNLNHLFLVRGELKEEIHLYEVPCLRRNLRSRAVFLLVEPKTTTIFSWCGLAVPLDKIKVATRVCKNLLEYEDEWKDFKVLEINEELNEDPGKNIFFYKLDAAGGNYHQFKTICHYTPRLFYLNSITTKFLATEVEYPLKSSKHVACFPFLQSHLYSADQPAFFVLDNHEEVWLWEGWMSTDSNLNHFKTELKLAKETAYNYATEKEKAFDITIPVRHVRAGFESAEFINLFPHWIDRNDITEIQLKESRTMVDIIKE